MRLAITGGTGFVGQHLMRLAVGAGHEVAALARRPQPAAAGVDWIAGDLDRKDALASLCRDADAVLHVAGMINAPDRSGFAAANVAGTGNVLHAALAGGVARFIHVSTLAARQPALSDYGWSKAESERLFEADLPIAWTIVRPPAVYGPGDLETLELFRMARRGLMLLPPPGRVSLIAAEDLVRLLLRLAESDEARSKVFEPDDGKPSGWSHVELAQAIGQAVGRHPLSLAMPAPVLRIAARLDRLFRGRNAKLTPDRARYYCHPDWVVSDAARPPASLWCPRIDTRVGLAATAAGYRAAGWL